VAEGEVLAERFLVEDWWNTKMGEAGMEGGVVYFVPRNIWELARYLPNGLKRSGKEMECRTLKKRSWGHDACYR
jgi:hypothetical protein